jgi:hypothetical protein
MVGQRVVQKARRREWRASNWGCCWGQKSSVRRWYWEKRRKMRRADRMEESKAHQLVKL